MVIIVLLIILSTCSSVRAARGGSRSAAARTAAIPAAAATSERSFFPEVLIMGIEWLKPGVVFGSILYALIGVLDLLAVLPHHRQAHALRPVAGDRREAERGAGIVVGAMCIGICIIVAAAIHGSVSRRRSAVRRCPAREPAHGPRPVEVALLAAVFVVAACGLVYELAAGALARYLLGDSVLQFSTVIGTYLFAMGVGSWLSRYLRAPAARALPAHRAAGGLVGGAMPALLFIANAYVPRRLPRCCCMGWCWWSACWSAWRSRW